MNTRRAHKGLEVNIDGRYFYVVGSSMVDISMLSAVRNIDLRYF